jgi:hypothetical protein
MSFFKNVFGSGSSAVEAKRKQEAAAAQQQQANAAPQGLSLFKMVLEFYIRIKATHYLVRRVAGIASIERRIEQSDQRNRAIIQNVSSGLCKY